MDTYPVPTITTSKPSILDLPFELRLQIYHRIFHNLEYYCRRKKDIGVQGQIHDFRGPLGTLRSCRQIRAEALPVFQRNLSLHSWTPSFTANAITTTASSSNSGRSSSNIDTCPPFIAANATRLIDPSLYQHRLYEQLTRLPPRVTFITMSGTPLYLERKELSSSSSSSNSEGHENDNDINNDLAARLCGIDDAAALRKALIQQEYLDLQASPPCNAMGERITMHFVHVIHWPNASLYQVCYLKIDPVTQTILERLIRFGVRDVPAKDVLLLTEGLSFPVLYCLSQRCFRYLAYTEDTLARVKMELGKQETFDRAWEHARRCG